MKKTKYEINWLNKQKKKIMMNARAREIKQTMVKNVRTTNTFSGQKKPRKKN